MKHKNSIIAPKVNAIVPNGTTDKPFTGGAYIFTVMETQEIWKDVPGFEGFYQISNMGRLKSFKRIKTGFILKQTNKNGDYFSIILQIPKKKRCCRIHTLMAETFLSVKTNKMLHSHHKDGNKQNNLLENIEVVPCKIHHQITRQQHPEYCLAMNKYNQETRPIPLMQYNKNNEFIREYKNSVEAQKATGVCYRNILQVANKEQYKPGKIRKQAGGFIWKLKTGRNDT